MAMCALVDNHRSRIGRIALGFAAALVVFPASAQNPAQLAAACDRLTAAELDLERPAGVAAVAQNAIDGPAAVSACLAAAKAAPGNRRIMFQLGRALRAAKQPEKARGAYQIAVQRGHALAAVNLGLMFARGVGGEQSPAEARRLYERAAGLGHPAGMRMIGIMYEKGSGVDQDETQAQGWNAKARDAFRELAATGNIAAMFQLAAMTEFGRGGPRDVTAARAMYAKAAAAGHAPSKKALDRLAKGASAPAKKTP